MAHCNSVVLGNGGYVIEILIAIYDDMADSFSHVSRSDDCIVFA